MDEIGHSVHVMEDIVHEILLYVDDPSHFVQHPHHPMYPFGQSFVVSVRLPSFWHQWVELLSPSLKGLLLCPDPMLFREKLASAERAGFQPILWHRQRSQEGPTRFPKT